ncbi:MAG: T9SS type A sorting domain-containing protein, partial [Saprospiraceae bacterium]|nr:T9SS type A sorting domain-containing protein [Saprospiraceae bacterium]
AQNWEQVGDLNWSGPKIMYKDSTTGLLFVSCQSLMNGPDTINGIFTFDGVTIQPLAKQRYDCGNVDCGPTLFLTRYRDYIYYSGGMLLQIDSVPLRGIGRWDGQHWSAGLPGLGGNAFDQSPFIDGHCIHEGKLYASGFFRTAEGDTCNSVAVWDGISWTSLNFPGQGFLSETPRVYHVFFFKGELYAAGNFYVFVDGEWVDDILRYDGANWHAVGGGLKGGGANIWDWAIYKDELYVCGYFRKIDGNAGNKIMRWDGQQWKDVGGGVCSPVEVTHGMTVHDGKLLLYGIFKCVGDGLPVNNIAAWDGERWCSFGNSTFDNTISRVAEYKGDIYIGGGFTEIDGQPVKYFAKWVGDHATDTCSAPISSAPEPKSEGCGLWPNPATDLLQVQAPTYIEALWVHDAQGREVLRPVVSGERVSLSVEHLPAGLYFVSLRAGGKIWGGKFVKM